MEKQTVLRSQITICPYKNFINEIIKLSAERKSSYVCFVNVHMLMEAYRDPEFCRVVNNADLAAPDGKPLSVYLRVIGGIRQERICGMDILPDVLLAAERSGKSVFFYGSTSDTLSQIIKRVTRELPRLRVAGCYSPPFRSLDPAEKHAVVRLINTSKTDLLLVALGCPKQEKWMAEHLGLIDSCMLGVGQALNVYAGTEKRLPRWARSLSLEWMYRLYLEPRRLWKRYLLGNSMFLALAGWSFIRRGFSTNA